MQALNLHYKLAQITQSVKAGIMKIYGTEPKPPCAIWTTPKSVGTNTTTIEVQIQQPNVHIQNKERNTKLGA